jgi:HEPN domain-containing protein
MTFKLNPISEVYYRLRLAEGFLKEAEDAFRRRDFRGVVASSQLAVENATKAVIAVYRVPSWSHDPSPELKELTKQVPIGLRQLIEELAEVVRVLAPEHGRVTYEEPTRGLTPWEIYKEKDAETALGYARRALELAKIILRELKVLKE